MSDVIENEEIGGLEKRARGLRYRIVQMAYGAGSERRAHPGPALSIVDILAALYLKTLQIAPAHPQWKGRDRLVLSKGHACLALYAILAELGYFPESHLATVRCLGSTLQGHPDMNKTPGIDMTTGSLGNGLGAGVGIALGARIDKRDFFTYVLVGDGELNEGVVWEAAQCAAKYSLDSLVSIVDANRLQSCGWTDDIMPSLDIAMKWKSFGWATREIDGHDWRDILAGLGWARQREGKPKVIIAHTIKGKGISFMENNNRWHQDALTDEEWKIAQEELRV